ncbi:hypothetical protein EV193_105421 [Herbihabitans rhizosphaerae]|uniref:Uncharacterized protein n=1 Tax=Herbihabitans rhizosphaerae TaxID=1872711 RepID=A0A4Q7KQ86_9PSEU|nr:hypothetical protein [Herbihabitans rhizosphaerae]RZS37861.1 hypothetical protein EV193_105421 [Herbihabitans rhizosphaerae]
MFTAESTSWQLRRGTDHATDMALWLRDSLALSVDTSPYVPSLDPSVPVHVPSTVDRAAVQREWPGWWDDVLRNAAAEGPSDLRARHDDYPTTETSPLLADRPAIRSALPATRESFGRYTMTVPRREPRRGLLITELVAELEAELGRRANPFRLVITEVRVDGFLWERLADDHLLASVQWIEDESFVRRELGPVIRELA